MSRHTFQIRQIICAFGLAAITFAGPAAAAAATPPLEALAALPQLTDCTLSPDGKLMAAVINQPDGSSVIVRPVLGGTPRVLFKADNIEFNIGWLSWARNDRLLISTQFTKIMNLEGIGNRPVVHSRLYAVNADGSNAISLFKARSTGFGATDVGPINQDDVIDFMPEDGHHVLLQISPNSEETFDGVYKIDIDTGKREIVQAPVKDISAWVSDQQHHVRLAVRLQRSGTMEVLHRPVEGGDWKVMWTSEAMKVAPIEPLGFARDPQLIYVLKRDDDKAGIYTARLDAPTLDYKLVFESELLKDDVSLIYDRATGNAVGVRYQVLGKTASSYWDASYKELARSLDEALPQRFNRLASFSDNREIFLLSSSAPNVPEELYAVTPDKIMLLSHQYEELKPGLVAGKQPITLKARDGLELHSFLTLPPGSSGKHLPTVVLVHGGPQESDDIDFDPEPAFLAGQGYAVLQVNFRGSTGYGRKFYEAGLRRWGLEMQDDLADALKGIVDLGIADPQKVCIMGASYGGYAALMGGIKQADIFKCVVAYAAPTDLIHMLELDQYSYSYYSVLLTRQIGNVHDSVDRARLIATSPARHAEDMKLPVLLMHGTNDTVVSFKDGETMYNELKSAGKNVRWVVLNKSNHYIANQTNRYQYFKEVQDFLAKYLK